jgi:hypothetical protein
LGEEIKSHFSTGKRGLISSRIVDQTGFSNDIQPDGTLAKGAPVGVICAIENLSGLVR